MMLAEEFREWRRRVQERRVRESVTKGRAEVHARWMAWLSRMEEAKMNNLPFSEPPPSLEDFKNGSGV